MNIPISWIREYADTREPDREYADKLTMIGQKVERYYRESDSLKNIVAGRIVSVEKHAGADNLSVCLTDIGEEHITVVTGAKNVKPGDVVPVALDGALLSGGKTISKGEIRGAVSEGMFCSFSELGFSQQDFPEAEADGIMILPEDTPAGEDIAKTLHLDDTIFEFEITPNRPDCMSVTGIARETAAAFSVPFCFAYPEAPKGSGNIDDILSVENRTDKCIRYSAAAVKNVRIAPSPAWMRERLRKCGLRPINNIVDITNYVMLEFGQPMHAFDLKNVKGQKIVVRQAKEGEVIVTLDGVKHPLDPLDMVIADSSDPSALAGVMGGEFSGIYDTTDTVIFESACFDSLSVRFTAKKLGLRTDSSSLFEKGLDPAGTIPALYRALELVELCSAGEAVGGIIDIYENPVAPVRLPLLPDRINKCLGTAFSAEIMVESLKRLGFSVTDEQLVVVPSFRGDIACTADLAEEIARVQGYGSIPSTIMSGIASARPSERAIFERELKQLCAGAGLFETTTLSFMSKKDLDNILVPDDHVLRGAVRISNPFGEETSLMRTTLLPSLMNALSRNFSVRAKSAALFELSACYFPSADENQLPAEPRALAAAGYGDLDYYVLKGLIERLISLAGRFEIRVERLTGNASYHPGRSARFFVLDTPVATAGELHPGIAENYGIRSRCYAAEIDVETLFALRQPTLKFNPLPRFPAVIRDLALVCDDTVLSSGIETVIKRAGCSLLETVTAFDVYRGEGIAEGKKSIAYNLIFRDSEKTLSDYDADKAVGDILTALKEINVSLREQQI